MPNPSEMARQEEEDRADYFKNLTVAYDLRLGKSTREAALTACRRLEKRLNIPHKSYNGDMG